MKAYVVSLRIDSHFTMNSKLIQTDTEKEAKAQAKDYFIGIFGKDRVNEALKNNKNVNVTEVEIEEKEN